MTPFSDFRQNPWDSTFSDRVMDPEIHVVAEFDNLPGIYGIALQDRPVAGTVTIVTNNTAATPYTEVTTNPLSGQFRVDYVRGLIQFNSADDGDSVEVNYSGRGTNVNLTTLAAIIGTISSTFTTITAAVSAGLNFVSENLTSVARFGAGNTSLAEFFGDIVANNKIRAQSTSGILIESANGTDVVTFGASNNPNASFNGVVSVPDGTAAAPTIKVGDEQNGLYSPGANRMGFVAGGVQQAEVNTGGLYAPGHVVQSVYSANSYQTITTGTTYTDILSALGVTWEIAITPKSSTSVINLFANLQLTMSREAGTQWAGILIQRKIGAGAYATIYTPTTDASGPVEITFSAAGATAVQFRTRYPLFLRDTPATTSAVSYRFQIRNRLSTSSPVITINEDTTTDGQSFVILNEVAV